MMTNDIVEAAERFKAVWGDGYLAEDLASKLTCTELESLTRLFRAIGGEVAAETWTESHAEHDECSDMHCRCDDEDCIAERTEL